MKKQILLFISILLSLPALHSQTFFKIAGGNVKVKGNPHIVLQNVSWVNNGQFSADSSTVTFSGTQSDTIDGSSSTDFWNINLNKTTGNLALKSDIGIDDTLYMNGGEFNLNGNDLTLGMDHGTIANESETNRILGPNGGEIIKVVILNAPTTENPGNMGAEISSSSNLGATVVKRGHIPQILPDGSSIERYYEVIPTNNSGLNASVNLFYFDAELNSLDELALESWNDDGTNWVNTYPDATDDIANYVTVTLDALGKMTLGEGAVKFAGKVFLEGAYNAGTGLMNESLNTNNLLPTTEPYSAFSTLVGGGGETVSPDVFNINGNNAIVDWIVVELRDKADSSVVLRSQAALLQRDGDIVGLDGSSAVTFAGMAEDDYFIGIKHRNHLGIRSPSITTLSRIETSHDFTSSLSQAWDNISVTSNDAMVDLGGGVFGLFKGDFSSNGFINIQDYFLGKFNSSPNQFSVYDRIDGNMDGNINIVDFFLGKIASSPNKAAHID